MILALIYLLFVLAAVALVWWGVNRLAVPEPIKTIVLVIIGLVALFLLWQIFFGSGVSLTGPPPRLR